MLLGLRVQSGMGCADASRGKTHPGVIPAQQICSSERWAEHGRGALRESCEHLCVQGLQPVVTPSTPTSPRLVP